MYIERFDYLCIIRLVWYQLVLVCPVLDQPRSNFIRSRSVSKQATSTRFSSSVAETRLKIEFNFLWSSRSRNCLIQGTWCILYKRKDIGKLYGIIVRSFWKKKKEKQKILIEFECTSATSTTDGSSTFHKHYAVRSLVVCPLPTT